MKIFILCADWVSPAPHLRDIFVFNFLLAGYRETMTIMS